MRGPKLTALSVRMPDQSISTETWDTPNSNKWYKKTPFIRGVFNFVESLTDGYKSLMKAAEKAGLDDEEEEPSKFEQKLRQLLGDKFMPFLQGCILLFSLAMALFFFAFLPTTLVGFFKDYINHPLALSALEGLTKIAILILYLALISNMSDIKRVFMYHGAEHKTIFCYEHGEELTVENVRKYTRFHPRCGTSFLVIVLLLSILVPRWFPGTTCGCAWDSKSCACPSSCPCPTSASSLPDATTTCSPASCLRPVFGPSA